MRKCRLNVTLINSTVCLCSDQGWGNTGDSKLFLDVYDPLTGEIAHRSSFVLTHNLRTIRRVFNFEDDLVRRSGTGHALRLVMVSAPWPGKSCLKLALVLPMFGLWSI